MQDNRQGKVRRVLDRGFVIGWNSVTEKPILCLWVISHKHAKTAYPWLSILAPSLKTDPKIHPPSQPSIPKPVTGPQHITNPTPSIVVQQETIHRGRDNKKKEPAEKSRQKTLKFWSEQSWWTQKLKVRENAKTPHHQKIIVSVQQSHDLCWHRVG